MGYKYDIDTKVKTKTELILYHTDDGTGIEYETVIPVGTEGIIDGQGRSSTYDFKPMYDVNFTMGENEITVTFIEKDFEENCAIE